MECPSCKNRPLRPTIIEEGLPGYTCLQCHGMLFDILAYRMWLQKLPESATLPAVATEPVNDSESSLLCPKCSKIMMKYRISDRVENRLDLCSHCGALWLDGGEWSLLAQLDLRESIPQILSAPWQNAVRMAQVEQAIEEKFEQALGTEDYRKVKAFKEWLASHEQAQQIRHYLTRGSL